MRMQALPWTPLGENNALRRPLAALAGLIRV